MAKHTHEVHVTPRYIRRMQHMHPKQELKCHKCGEPIQEGEDIVVKYGSKTAKTKRYHTAPINCYGNMHY